MNNDKKPNLVVKKLKSEEERQSSFPKLAPQRPESFLVKRPTVSRPKIRRPQHYG